MALACAGFVARAEVSISEFMAANGDTVRDEDGDYSDWIELHNTGPQTVDLGGWFLTDSTLNLTKWSFPSTNLPADGYLVVFASEKNRRVPGKPLHTNFKLAADGESLALLDTATNVISALAPTYPPQVTDISFGVGSATETVTLLNGSSPARWRVPFDGSLGDSWIVPDFDASAWASGRAALGFETSPENYASLIQTDVRAEMAGQRNSCFVRIPFVVENVTRLSNWRLRVQFDDGFVAWLNGARVTERNSPDPLNWDSTATANHPDAEALVPEEFDLTPYFDRLMTGTNWLAIQVMNVSASSSDLLVVPEITAERAVSAGETWRYFTLPTPGEANRGGGTTVGPLLREVRHFPTEPHPGEALVVTAHVQPTFSPVASVKLAYRVMFAAETELVMRDDGVGGDEVAGDNRFTAVIPGTAASAGQMVRYIVRANDGVGRTSRSPLYFDPFDSQQYHGTVVADAGIGSRLPVIHLFFEDPGASESWTGTRGVLFHAGELYDNVEVRVHGQSSSGFSKKGHNLDFPRDHRFQFGTNAARVKDLKLLTNWGDKSRVRNTLAHEFSALAGSAAHFAHPVRVQRNGQFHAILDLMEDADDRWLERLGRAGDGALYKMYNNLGSAGGNEKKTRKEEDFSDLQTLVNALAEERPLADRVAYAWDNLDLPQTISYFTAMALVSSQDHGHKNYFVYRDTPGTGEWAIFPWDVDLTWGRNWLDSAGYFTDTLYTNNVLNFYNPAQQGKPANPLYNLIFQHPEFRRMYLRRLRTVMDTILLPPGASPGTSPIELRIRDLMDLMDPPAAAQSDADLDYAQWGSWGNRNQARAEAQRILDLHLPGRREWLFSSTAARLNNERIPEAQPTYAAVRFGRIEFNPASRDQTQEFVELTHAEPYAVDVSGWQLAGAVRFTFKPGTVIPEGRVLFVSPAARSFRARPASPRGGEGLYVQGPYSGQLSARGEMLTLTDAAGRLVDRVTYAGDPTPAQHALRITEIMFDPPAPPPGSPHSAQDFEFIEFKNIGNAALDLTGVRLTDGVLFDFTSSAMKSLAPEGFTLVVPNRAAFATRYGGDLPVAGAYTGSLENNGERLRLDDGAGEKVLEFDYEPGWQRLAAGRGRSLTIVDANRAWSTWGDAASWRVSSTDGGSPGREDQPPPDLDTDGDGLPDVWELEHSLNPGLATDALEDADGDGASNLAEFRAGTNPRSGVDVLGLAVSVDQAGVRTLHFRVPANRKCDVLVRDVISADVWQVLTSFSAAADPRPVTFPDGAAVETRFYQLRVSPGE